MLDPPPLRRKLKGVDLIQQLEKLLGGAILIAENLDRIQLECGLRVIDTAHLETAVREVEETNLPPIDDEVGGRWTTVGVTIKEDRTLHEDFLGIYWVIQGGKDNRFIIEPPSEEVSISLPRSFLTQKE